jgi:hypothetical protein
VGDAEDHDPERNGDLRRGQARPIACRHRVPEIRDQGEQLRCAKPGDGVGHLPQAWITKAQDGSFCHACTCTLETSLLIFGCLHRHQEDLRIWVIRLSTNLP